MNPHYRGIAFLLSVGCLPLGCPNEKDDTDGNTSTTGNTGTGTDATDATPTTGPGTTGSTTGGTTGGNDTTNGTTDATNGTTGPVVTSGTDTQASATTDTDTSGDTDLPPPTDPTCLAYAEHYVECVQREARYQVYVAQYCEAYKGYAFDLDGQACLNAMESYFVCLSTVDCAEFESENSCPEQTAAVEAACPSLNESGTSGGTSG